MLESEFKSNHSIKSKCLKWIVKKYYQQYKSLCKQKSYIVESNKQSKIKPIKTGKELGTRYYLRCKDYTHNFKPPEVKMKNNVLREK